VDKLSNMRAFVQVAERGGFSAAASAMGTTRSAASKQVQALEDGLGVRLLNRTTRQVSLTDVGWTYYERVVRLLEELDGAEREVQSLQLEPKGTLRVNGPMSFGTLFLGSAIADFMAENPQLQVQLTLTDRLIDPVAEGADVTIRVAALEDSSLIARKLAEMRRCLCASAGYLARHGEPITPHDLAGFDCLHYGHVAANYRWSLAGADGEVVNVPIRSKLCANNGEVIGQAAVRGLGIAALPEFIIANELASGALKTVLSGWRPPDIAVYALYTPNRHLAAKVRLFIDFLARRFGSGFTGVMTNCATQ
jgi:DNA-binding transcriptional LysR family regulator